jgi:50S ribosomal subunit-associated GTPase HflX
MCDPGILTVFVANKIDVGCSIDISDACEFAESNHSVLMNTSAQSGENIDRLFEQIATLLASVQAPSMGIDITECRKDARGEESASSSKCC